ncbi:MAG TPA: ABC transporter ATP-binding protein [Actinopolymorphaceae bacterium]|nr:ABC transporter ATP-binding protein [Actinopolymorphaceae bacterium]
MSDVSVPMWVALSRTTGRYVLHARLLWLSAPGLSLLCLLVTMGSAAAGTVALVTTGHLIGSLPGLVRDGAGSAAADRSWFWLAATAVALSVGPLLSAISTALTPAVSARYLATTFDMLLEIGTHPYGIGVFDDSKLTGRLDGLRQSMRNWAFVSGVDSTWTVVAHRLGGIGALVVVCTWRWWVGAVLVLGFLLLSKTFTTWIDTLYDELLEVTGGARREATYVRGLLTSGETGKEVRLFGLSGWLLDRFRTSWLAAMTLVWRHRSRTLRPIMVALTLSFFLNVGAFAMLARDALSGGVSLAVLATLVQALFALEAFGPIGDPQSELARNTAAATKLVEVRRTVGLDGLPPRRTAEHDGRRAAADRTTPATSTPVEAASASTTASDRPRLSAATIDLADVTFTYPTRDEPAFHDLTLRIPAGQSVGIVGVNGAGKSTLIKLLCGLYPPDRGTVRIDGHDPAVDPTARGRVAVIFQDFVRYHLSLRDNVGFGARSHLHDDAVLGRALADGGAVDLLDRLGKGWETVLSPEYADGTDLSGGQWQRVALARAFASLAAGAGVLVLDEPTASLDVRAEAALFDRFLEVTRGMTTLLVSHRLSSVRHAERIVVIGPADGDRGAIVEDGSHDELMAVGGAYAQMFTLQASRFAAAGTSATMDAVR